MHQARLIWKQLRPHQWVKNLLVFVPLIGAHQFSSDQVWFRSALSFISFSLIASAVYVLNDLMDVNSDRNHPSKRDRPFASGKLPVAVGYIIFPLLVLFSLSLAWTLSGSFASTILFYLILNCLYSWKLKETAILDVTCLGIFYSLRVIGGGFAAEIEISEWLLSFCSFFFFSLALGKRFIELKKRASEPKAFNRRGYVNDDILTIQCIGIGSGLLSIAVLAIYFSSPTVSRLYTNAKTLSFTLPLLLFWLGRFWLMANRCEIDDDPVLFAVLDRVSWAAGIICVVLFIISI